jgi:hypothetical protein
VTDSRAEAEGRYRLLKERFPNVDSAEEAELDGLADDLGHPDPFVPAITAAAFEAAYAARSGTTVAGLHRLGRYAEPCNCGDDDCEGWALGHQQEDAIVENAGRKDDQRRPVCDRNGAVVGHKRMTPNEAMAQARKFAEAGQSAGPVMFHAEPDPERQAAMLRMNLGGH